MANRGSLRIAIEDFLNSFQVGERIKNSTTEYLEFLEDEALEVYDDLADQYGLKGKIFSVGEKGSDGKPIKRKPAILPVIISGIIGMALAPIAAGASVIGNEIRYILDKERRTNRFDLGSLAQMYHMFPEASRKIIDYMQQLGVRDEDLYLLQQVAEKYPTPFEMMADMLRGGQTRTEVTTALRKLGYREEHIEAYFRLSQQIPPVSDLISMAVREAFNDQAASRFRYDEDFPQTILPFTRQQGLSDDWVRRYWRAHWTLPSPQQAFEMFHRLRPGRTQVPFSQADLNQYLITADIPAFFRDRMKEIAYNPLTRVDVRRMFGMGVLDQRGVLEAYLDEGFSPRDAELMTQFTVRFEGGAEKELSRTAITSAFKRGMFSQEEALAELTDILGSAELARFYIEMALYELASDEQDAILEGLKIRYIEGMIDRNTTVARLGQLNLPSTQQNTLLLKWDVARENKIAIPSISTYENWYKREVITANDVRAGLLERGIRDADITRYIREFDHEIHADRQKELERAQKEQERLISSNKASEYQKRVADVDVLIAQKKLAISNVKAAMFDLTEEDDPTELKQDIAELEVDIAELNLRKARIKAER